MKLKTLLTVIIINAAEIIAAFILNKSIWFGTYEGEILFDNKKSKKDISSKQ